MKRRITVSRQGIHFEVAKYGVINANWRDLVGQGLDRDLPYRIIRSMIRFWGQFGAGIGFIIRGKW